MIDPNQLTQTWQTNVDGAVYAEPLVVQGHILVVTENDSLYSLDEHSGAIQWHVNVGIPVQLSTLPCGNIDPLGITSTPVYDPQTGLLFAVAEIRGPSHILVGIDLQTGQVRIRRTIDLPGMDPRTHQQRSALALYKNHVYVAFGGLAGDCGNYRGTIIAAQTDGQGPLLSYRVPTPREGAIWAPSGPAIDANGNVFVAVGNGEVTQGNWDHSDSILRLSADLALQDGFAPAQWPHDNETDADLGSTGPLPLPNNLMFSAGKAGIGYLLHADNLGGVGGQLNQLLVCPGARSMGGAALLGLQIYVPCNNGVQLVNVGPGTKMSLGWKNKQLLLPPVIGGHTLYSLDPSGTLYAVDASTGQLRAQITLGPVAHFATPTLSANHIFVGTMNSVFSVNAA
ncbi:MAG TPA: PQQ-binding-like beta-propeller repeat protein [Ktedonobacteraceae bacterium]|nr:PQQ-binding-like beta-propeller repeat protein [Ktedonobacteraceae bacterium]